MGYVQRVGSRQAEKLEPRDRVTTQAVRRRLTAAAETRGRNVEVRRTGGTVYFWLSEGWRRGRPRKNSAA